MGLSMVVPTKPSVSHGHSLRSWEAGACMDMPGQDRKCTTCPKTTDRYSHSNRIQLVASKVARLQHHWFFGRRGTPKWLASSCFLSFTSPILTMSWDRWSPSMPCHIQPPTSPAEHDHRCQAAASGRRPCTGCSHVDVTPINQCWERHVYRCV